MEKITKKEKLSKLNIIIQQLEAMFDMQCDKIIIDPDDHIEESAFVGSFDAYLLLATSLIKMIVMTLDENERKANKEKFQDDKICDISVLKSKYLMHAFNELSPVKFGESLICENEDDVLMLAKN